MEIRDAKRNEIEEVVRMHISAFPGFFLTSLGPGFLTHLYRGFLEEEGGILQVAVDSDRLLGFAAGTSVPETFFSVLRKRRGARFVLSALPGALSAPLVVLRKLFNAAFYQGETPSSLSRGALLSSLGVVPAAMGSGAGRALLTSFERRAAARGAALVYLTTDAIGNERVNSFYRKMGYQREGAFMQSGNRSMLRYMKPLQPIEVAA